MSFLIIIGLIALISLIAYGISFIFSFGKIGVILTIAAVIYLAICLWYFLKKR